MDEYEINVAKRVYKDNRPANTSSGEPYFRHYARISLGPVTSAEAQDALDVFGGSLAGGRYGAEEWKLTLRRKNTTMEVIGGYSSAGAKAND